MTKSLFRHKKAPPVGCFFGDCRKTLWVFPTKGLQSAARIICPSVTDKFHTGSLRGIFSHAHVGAPAPPAGGQGGEKPRTGTGGEDAGRKFPARPVRTPGRAHGLFEAHSGRTPWPRPQCCRFFPVPLLAIVYGEQAATPPPSKQRGGRASGGHTWPPNIKCGWCWPGAGVPGQRRRAASGGGGAKPRAALLPRCKHGPRGGGPAGRSSSLSPYTVAAVTYGDKKGPNGP